MGVMCRSELPRGQVFIATESLAVCVMDAIADSGGTAVFAGDAVKRQWIVVPPPDRDSQFAIANEFPAAYRPRPMDSDSFAAAQLASLPAMPRRAFVWLTIYLGTLAALGPLAIDMYLPAFPRIAADFAVQVPDIQRTLASYFIGLALGQLFYGPLADRFVL